jgi:hypothetical protein
MRSPSSARGRSVLPVCWPERLQAVSPMPRQAHNRNDIDTLALAVQNREELAECVATAEAGPLPAELMARVNQAVNAR